MRRLASASSGTSINRSLPSSHDTRVCRAPPLQTCAARGDLARIKVLLPHGVAHYLLNRKRDEILRLEQRYQTEIHMVGRMDIRASDLQFEVETRSSARKGEMEIRRDLEPRVKHPELAEVADDIDDVDEPEAAAGEEKAPEEKRRRRPRRRRRGGEERREDARQETPASAAGDTPDSAGAEATAEAAETTSETSDAPATRRRRSRGGRGRRGRGRKRGDAEAAAGAQSDGAEDLAGGTPDLSGPPDFVSGPDDDDWSGGNEAAAADGRAG
jgi:ribonuclease E